MQAVREVSLSPELPTAFMTLSDAKAALGVSGSAEDTRIQRLIDAGSLSIEKYCNAVIAQRTVTETINPDDPVMNLTLTHSPVIALTSLEIDDDAQDLADYRVNKALGSIRAVDGSQIAGYEIETVYTAGFAATPAAVAEALRELVQYLYTSGTRSAAVNTGIKSESVEGVGSATYAGADAVPMMAGENGISLPVAAAVHLAPYVRSFVV